MREFFAALRMTTNYNSKKEILRLRRGMTTKMQRQERKQRQEQKQQQIPFGDDNQRG
jgi:hypothetical protein